MASNSESAASGGLLVILGIVVALIAGYLFFQYRGGASGPDVTINADIPTPTVPSTPGQ